MKLNRVLDWIPQVSDDNSVAGDVVGAFTFDVFLSDHIVGDLCLDEDVGALIDLGQHPHLSFSSALEPCYHEVEPVSEVERWTTSCHEGLALDR